MSQGDLVQLKELPVGGGSFELRTKAMDVLLTVGIFGVPCA